MRVYEGNLQPPLGGKNQIKWGPVSEIGKRKRKTARTSLVEESILKQTKENIRGDHAGRETRAGGDRRGKSKLCKRENDETNSAGGECTPRSSQEIWGVFSNM